MRREHIYFTGTEIALAVKMEDVLGKTIEMLSFLLKKEKAKPYVIMLISAEEIDLKSLLQEQKRDTDILFEVDADRSVYAVVCQGTKIDGGYRFAERIMRLVKLDQAKDPYCIQLEVDTPIHETKEIVLTLIETCLQAKEKRRTGEIIMKTMPRV